MKRHYTPTNEDYDDDENGEGNEDSSEVLIDLNESGQIYPDDDDPTLTFPNSFKHHA
jgi:hypothetical protein